MSSLSDDFTPHDSDKPRTIPPASWVSTRDAVEFADHLALLTRSGLPLPSGLRALAAEISSRKLKRILIETADQLDAGVALDETLRERAIAFPPYLRGLILAGTRGGVLADVLAQFVRYRSVGDEMRRRFWVALSYPILSLIAVSLLITFIMFTVVSPFEVIMKDFGINLPLLTIILFQIQHFLSEFGGIILLNLSIAVVLFLVAFRFLLGPADRRRAVLMVPLIGNVLRFGTVAEFCHLMAALVETKMPLPEALDLASQAVGDPSMAEAGAKIRKDIERGLPFATALWQWKGCPAGLTEILVWADSHQNLGESLHLAGDMFEARARSQSGFATVMLATLTMVLVAIGVGMTILALFLPMITLLSRLSG